MSTEPSPLDPFAPIQANPETIDLATTQSWAPQTPTIPTIPELPTMPVPATPDSAELVGVGTSAEVVGEQAAQLDSTLGLGSMSIPTQEAVTSLSEAVRGDALPTTNDAFGSSSAISSVPSPPEMSVGQYEVPNPVGSYEPSTGATPADALTAGAVATGITTASGNGGGPSFPTPPSFDAGAGEPPKKKRVGAMIGVGLGVLGLAAGAAFAVTQIRGGEKANTPEQAIETFYTSFENGDAIGLAKTLAPGERDVMLDSMVPMLAEMSRLKFLEKDFDPAKIKGYTAKMSNFKAKSTVVRPDLAHVVVTSGKLSTTFNANDLPFGEYIRKIGGDDLKSSKSTTQSSDIGSDADNPFVVQKIGKRWYLSLNYSIAESARLQSDDTFKVPAKGAGVPANGAASPEAAVSDMMQAMADLNARRIIELLPPDEFAALHDYAGQFVDKADDGVKDVAKKYTLKVTPKLLTSKIADDRVVVTVADLPFNLKADDSDFKLRAVYAAKSLDASLEADGNKGVLTWKNQVFNGSFTSPEGEKVSAKYAKECLTLTVDGEDKKACGQEGLAKLFSDISGQPIDTSTLNTDGLGFSNNCKPSNKGKPTIGFTTIKRDGKWYVSPTRTMLDSITAVMKKLEPKDIDCLSDQIEKSIKSFQNNNSDPDAIDPTFIDPTDPDADPFATDTFPDFPSDSTFPSDEDIFSDDTFNFSDDTFDFSDDGFDTEVGTSDTFSTDALSNETVVVEQ